MRARQKALKDFDERIVIQKTLGVYQELLSPLNVSVPALRSAP
jgi:hypothetical protein